MINPRKSIYGVQLVEAVLKKIKFVKGQIGCIKKNIFERDARFYDEFY
jgi:hypothetical protein